LQKDIEELRQYLRETRVLLDTASLERAASVSGRNSRPRTNFFLEVALRGANVGALDLIPDRANQISMGLFCELHAPFISELPKRRFSNDFFALETVSYRQIVSFARH
jgi:hypothetical protein